MRRTASIACGALMGALAVLVACQKETEASQLASSTAARRVQQVRVVCLYDGAGLWGAATAEKGAGQFKATISLGETVTWTGETEMGKSYGGEASKFYKVKTSVDDVGWIEEPYFAIDATPVATTKATLRYQRDNPTSAIGTETVPPMTVGALLQEKGDWVRVKLGGRKDVPFLTGYAAQEVWIKRETISVSEKDVTVAVLGLRALVMDAADAKTDALKAIVDDATYGDSQFIPLLQEELTKARRPDEIQVNVDVD